MRKYLFTSLAAALMLCAGTGCTSDRNVDDFTSGLNGVRSSSQEDSTEPSSAAESSSLAADASSGESGEESAEETSEPESSTEPESSASDSIVLCDWRETDRWTWYNDDGTDATFALLAASDHTLMIDTTKSGPNPWSVQAKYTGVRLKQGCTYRLTFDYSCQLFGTGAGYDVNAHHGLVTVLQDYEPYDPYFESTLRLDRKDFQTMTYEFEMTEPSDDNVFIGFSFGNLGNTGCTAQIRHIQLEQIAD